MNEIDFTVIQTVTRFYRQQAELPRVCLVHPSWFGRLTIEKVYVYIPPAPRPGTFTRERSPEILAHALQQRYTQQSVPVRQLELRSLPADIRYRLPQSEWVLCLTRRDILLGLEMNPERHLLPDMSMTSLMDMSENERYWLELKRHQQKVEREY